MRIAHNKDGNRIYIDEVIGNNEQYYCPACGAELILKRGNIKTHHFAHKSLIDCDTFNHDMSEWHLNWQETFPKENREVVIEMDIPENVYRDNIYYLDWVKQSVNLDRLLDGLPDYLDITDYIGSIKLGYGDNNNILYIEFMEQVVAYGKLLYESAEEPDMLDCIEISDKIDEILEKYKGTYDNKLIDRLQFIASEAFVDEQLGNIDLFSAIFSEYYWNKYFDKTDFDILSSIRIEENNE